MSRDKPVDPRREKHLSAREARALDLENTGSSSSRRGAITGRYIKGQVRKVAEQTQRGDKSGGGWWR